MEQKLHTWTYVYSLLVTVIKIQIYQIYLLLYSSN